MPLQGSQRLTLTRRLPPCHWCATFHGAREAFVVKPAVFPSVKLDEVELFDAEMARLLLTYASMWAGDSNRRA